MTEREEIRMELDRLQRDIAISERSEIEQRVTDRAAYVKAMERRRAQQAALQARYDELVAREESEADIEYGGST
jgi:hypothetical protein